MSFIKRSSRSPKQWHSSKRDATAAELGFDLGAGVGELQTWPRRHVHAMPRCRSPTGLDAIATPTSQVFRCLGRQRVEAAGDGAMWNREIGIGLTGFGVLFTFLGVIFFFDKALLAVGNILFVAGVTLTIGMKGTISFFLKPRKYKGSILSGAGFCLVVFGWAFIGMMVEAYGCFLLFSGFWPTALVFLSRLPILGPILQQPFIVEFCDRFRERRIPV